MKDHERLVQQCDEAIKAGRTHEVGKLLAALNTAKVPRKWRRPLANICRRAGHYALGLTLLARVIHPQKTRSGEAATPEEIAEYGVLLLRSGALGEARAALHRVSPEAVPEVSLYRAFHHFTVFEFEDAVPLVERYLTAALTPYQRLVGQTNLAFALSGSGQFDRAHRVLSETIEVAAAQGHVRLRCNCHALKAEVYLNQGAFSETRREVEAGLRQFGPAKTNDQMFLLKWIAMLEGVQSRSLGPVEKYRELARDGYDWNGVREADRIALKIEFQPERFHRLLFGTPFTAYRERVLRELGQAPEIATYVHGVPGAPTMDLVTGEIDGHRALNPGRKTHQLLEILQRDLYQPHRLGGLFFELFPGSYFDLESSPDRVHQIIRRARQWLEASALPVSIAEFDGFFSLRIDGAFAFRLPLQREPVDSQKLRFDRLRREFGARGGFTAQQARELLGVSRFTLQTLVKWAFDANELERVGTSNQVAYRFPTKHGKAAA